MTQSVKEVQQIAPEQQCAWDIQVSFLYALNIGNMQFHLHKIHRPSLWKRITGTVKIWLAEQRKLLQPLCNLTWKVSRLCLQACDITNNVRDVPLNYGIRGGYFAANIRLWHVGIFPGPAGALLPVAGALCPLPQLNSCCQCRGCLSASTVGLSSPNLPRTGTTRESSESSTKGPVRSS